MLGNLAEAVCDGRRSGRSLVEEAIGRIERLDPALHAVVALRADGARAEAGALDARIRGGASLADLPLAGLPFLVKDVEDVAGLPTSHGSLLFANAPVADGDSRTVARLRAAGAIPIGKSNTSEFAFEGVTDNRVFGRTLNPWNRDWSPGGSSGGSAAALAAGLVPIATATDAGGSVRGPAALCGLVGLKPTNGLLAREGAPMWLDLVTDGILATSVADAALLLDILAAPRRGDPIARPRGRGAKPPPLPRRLLSAARLHPGPPLPATVARLFQTALDGLARTLRLPVEELRPEAIFPGPHHPDDDSLVLLEAETVEWLGRARIEASRDLFDRHFAAHLDEALGVTVDAYVGARRRRFDHARRLDALLAGDAILATPTFNVEGLLADGTVPDARGRLVNALANTNPQNVTGHPAISLPAGRLPNGVPFGLQLTGPRYGDHVLLRVAAAWERAMPWPLAADGYSPFESRPSSA